MATQNHLKRYGCWNHQISSILTGISSQMLSAFRQQMDHNNIAMVNKLTNPLATDFNPMNQNTNDSYQTLHGVLNRIVEVMANQTRPHNHKNGENMFKRNQI